jgi:hypothetical protein
MLLFWLFLAACIDQTMLPTSTSLPTFTSSPTVSQTFTPTESATGTSVPTFTSTPDFCSAAGWKGEILVLSGQLFTALEPGGPPTFDEILITQNPSWADFRQQVRNELWTAGVIFHEISFGPELGTGVNPAVVLVTYGVDHDWSLPSDGDLASKVDLIRGTLHQYELDAILGKVDWSQYPPIANAGTFSLYRYYDGDLHKLEEWCRTFAQVFGKSPTNFNE